MTIPFYRSNVLSGTKEAWIIDDPDEYAYIISHARRPLLVLGPRAFKINLGGKPLIEYALQISRALNIPICATAHTRKGLIELGVRPESNYDFMEIINYLKDPGWAGVRGEGNHDLVIFLGIRADLCEQGLSTLKHFAPHIKTITLCPYIYPNASYSLPNLDPNRWKGFLDNLIKRLKVG